MGKKQRNLSDLEKARNHFIKATTEWMIGTGFALRGVKDLLKNREGRKVVSDFTGSFIGKGLGLMMSLTEMLKQVEERKSKGSRSRKKKTRKIEVE